VVFYDASVLFSRKGLSIANKSCSLVAGFGSLVARKSRWQEIEISVDEGSI